ncbi:uncharacterized protein TNCV_2356271 [Trichonephila clavipes]|nr:uncharacterized protein TNCV_2356271 [Trichonephila clavipes]
MGSQDLACILLSHQIGLPNDMQAASSSTRIPVHTISPPQLSSSSWALETEEKGSDIIGKLFTGECNFSKGLTAVNTRIGWTVIGKLSCESKFELENSLLVHSLFTNREKISDLWELDSLGIKDLCEKKSKLELQDLALKHFENTVLRDDEGRYIVSIPWIEGNERLEDHYSLAKGRLEKTVKTLKFTGRLFDYEQLFVDWEKEGIIEKIAQDEPKIGGKFHYLPHRPVFKEN